VDIPEVGVAHEDFLFGRKAREMVAATLLVNGPPSLREVGITESVVWRRHQESCVWAGDSMVVWRVYYEQRDEDRGRG